MSIRFFLAESILTIPLRVHLGAHQDAVVVLDRFDPAGYALIEVGHIADLQTNRVHQGVGIVLRNRGHVQFLSDKRGDELENPIVRLRTDSITTELLARATLAGYFGFKAASWTSDAVAASDGIVVDERAALVPPESGFREDLVRAWFVLTGLPLITHVLVVPDSADPETTAVLADLINACDFSVGTHVAGLATETGAEPDDVQGLFDEIRTELTVDDRRSIPELFARARLGARFGAVPWLTV